MTLVGVILGPQLTKFASGHKPKFTGTGIASAALSAQVGNERAGAPTLLRAPMVGTSKLKKAYVENVIDLDR